MTGNSSCFPVASSVTRTFLPATKFSRKIQKFRFEYSTANGALNNINTVNIQIVIDNNYRLREDKKTPREGGVSRMLPG
jgi:hypothetical protein